MMPSRLKSGVITLAGAACVLGIGGAASIVTFGSVDAGLAYLRGEQLYASPFSVALGTVTAGDAGDFTVTVRNLSSRPLRLLGAKTSCSCITSAELPLEIAAGESRLVHFSIRAPESDAEFAYVIEFYSDVIGPKGPFVKVLGRSANRSRVTAAKT
jgi:hypothetical protein